MDKIVILDGGFDRAIQGLRTLLSEEMAQYAGEIAEAEDYTADAGSRGAAASRASMHLHRAKIIAISIDELICAVIEDSTPSRGPEYQVRIENAP